MISIRPAGALALALFLAACGAKQGEAPENQTAMSGAPAVAAADKVYSGTGKVQSMTADKVAIAHGPISGIGWPAMTMTFKVAQPAMLRSLMRGSRVRFTLEGGGQDAVIQDIRLESGR